jgi:thiamine-monophosphate kinase
MAVLGEFEIIARYFTRPSRDPDVVLGVGDDAAVISVGGLLAATVDTMLPGVHFPDGMAASLIGYRLMAVNLSDLAAMGAQPRWATLALTLPKPDELWLNGFSRGLYEHADRYGVSLVGGNLTRGPLNLTLHLLGRVEAANRLMRGGGHIGDDVYVTGTLGDGAAGIALINERATSPDGSAAAALKQRFYRPEPRVAAGLALGPLASAAIDISDGLLADLGHICTASGCGALIDAERVPLSAELLSTFPPQTALDLALAGGDDYELCFTAAPPRAREIEIALEACGTSARRIGQLVPGQTAVVRRDGRIYTPSAAGYRHF